MDGDEPTNSLLDCPIFSMSTPQALEHVNWMWSGLFFLGRVG